MPASIPYLGEVLSLTTAIFWAFAVILFKRSGETARPLALNLFKTLLAAVLIPPTMLLLGQPVLHPAPLNDYLLLFISGALGIAISDTLFFKALNILGAGRSAIVDCTYSPLVILQAMIFLGETLSVLQLIGVVLIVTAVLLVGLEKDSGAITRRRLVFGIVLSLVYMITLTVSLVMVKPLLERSPVLWVTQMRLLSAIPVLLLMLAVHPGRREILGSLSHADGWRFIVPGAVLGNYLALITWLGGMKYATASVASALNQTSNLFVFILAAVFLRERVTLIRLMGILLGAGGVYLATFG